MKIAIIGAGAMGGIYGGKLSTVLDNQVFLIDIWKEHVDEINRRGIQMEEEGRSLIFGNVKGTMDADSVGICDLAIIFVKSTMTKTAVQINAGVFGPNTVALTLQNGLGNAEQIAEVIGADKVIAGTTAHGATMLGPGKIKHAGWGTTVIGEPSGEKTERVLGIAAAFERVGIKTEVSDNVQGLIWDKLLVNVGINALTGLTRLQNGRLLDDPRLEEIMEMAVREGEAVAKALNIKLCEKNPVSHTKDVCRATAENRSSMLQDVLKGKRTEIEMMNGAVVREGKSVGIDTPVNRTLTNLIRFQTENT